MVRLDGAGVRGEKEAAELLEAGRVYGWARVDSYYADSGELYDSIPAELTVGKTG